MLLNSFRERLAALYEETVGGKYLFATGYTAVRQVAVIGQIHGRGNSPFLYVVQAPLTDRAEQHEALRTSVLQASPASRQVAWLRRGSQTRVILHNKADALRVILPAAARSAILLVDGVPVTPAYDMVPGEHPPQALPESLQAMTELLLARMPPDLVNAA